MSTNLKPEEVHKEGFFEERSGPYVTTGFYNENGEEIKLKPGKIWIEVVNGRGDVSWISS